MDNSEYKATSPCDVCTRKHLSCAMSYAVFARALDITTPGGYSPSIASLALAGGVGWARAIINFTESLNHDASLMTLGVQGLTQYVDAAHTLNVRNDSLEGLPTMLTNKERYQTARLRRALFNAFDTKLRGSWIPAVLAALDEMFDYTEDAPETNFHTAVYFCVAHLLEAVREHTAQHDSTELKSLATMLATAYVSVDNADWETAVRDALLLVANTLQAQIDLASNEQKLGE